MNTLKISCVACRSAVFLLYSLDSPSSPDVSTCYQTAVNDDDEEDHLVRAAVVDNSADFSDFESGEERRTQVSNMQRVTVLAIAYH